MVKSENILSRTINVNDDITAFEAILLSHIINRGNSLDKLLSIAQKVDYPFSNSYRCNKRGEIICFSLADITLAFGNTNSIMVICNHRDKSDHIRVKFSDNIGQLFLQVESYSYDVVERARKIKESIIALYRKDPNNIRRIPQQIYHAFANIINEESGYYINSAVRLTFELFTTIDTIYIKHHKTLLMNMLDKKNKDKIINIYNHFNLTLITDYFKKALTRYIDKTSNQYNKKLSDLYDRTIKLYNIKM